jgi:antitoxin (DNA-binding transcriptional repressor) of toxin-antitoxin stability system
MARVKDAERLAAKEAEPLTATDLRKNLFRMLDVAAQGGNVEFTHKGVSFRIVPLAHGSRLARLTPRNAAGDSDVISSGWDDAAQAEWEAELQELLGD